MDEATIVNTAALNAWWAQNFIHVSIWTLIVAMILVVAVMQRLRSKSVAVASEAEPKKKDPLFTRMWQTLKLRLLYKPRGFVMKKRKLRAKAEMEDEMIALRQLMVVEHAWIQGELSHAGWKRNVDRIAERFSNPKLYHNARLKLLKAELKMKRKEAKLPLTLEEAGVVPPTGTTNEGKENQNLLNFKAA